MATNERAARMRPIDDVRASDAVEAIEEVRRGPLQPEVPLDPEAPLRALDPDALEALHDPQELADEVSSDGGIVGESPVDRRRAAILAGGDVDAAREEANGEEAVGGSTPTPDQDVVDDLGRAAGVTYGAGEPLRLEEKEAERDEKRWELHPASSEDYEARVRALRERQKKTR